MRQDIPPVVLVTPVYGNRDTLEALAARVEASLGGRSWRLRFVVDASPDDSLAVARRLAAADSRLAVTGLATNVGQHRALARGLAEEPSGAAWVCLDADLQDPPEAVPVLLDRLEVTGAAAVFAARRGRYESAGRRLTGRLHRAALRRVTGVPPGSGAFVALGPVARDAVLGLDAPSIVAALGVSRLPLASVPVERSPRLVGRSSWSSAARVRQSVRALAWAATFQRGGEVRPGRPRSAGFARRRG